MRTATPEKSMRLTWEDGTRVQLYFTAKGEKKSQVAIQHVMLPTKDEAAMAKAFWGDRLEALGEILAPS